MPSIYDEISAAANDLMAEFGQPVSIVRKVTGAYDPGTGKASVTTSSMQGIGMTLAYTSGEINGTNVLATDVKIMLAPTGITSAPQNGDKITAISPFTGVMTTFTVLDASATAPAGVPLLYEVHARL